MSLPGGGQPELPQTRAADIPATRGKAYVARQTAAVTVFSGVARPSAFWLYPRHFLVMIPKIGNRFSVKIMPKQESSP
jgi:hypothetical protein